MFLYTTDFISGKNIETLGMVRGFASKNFAIDSMAEAEKHMVEEAEKLGADAIIDISYAIGKTSVVIVSGTAVKFVEEKEFGSSTAEGFGPRHVRVKLVD